MEGIVQAKEKPESKEERKNEDSFWDESRWKENKWEKNRIEKRQTKVLNRKEKQRFVQNSEKCRF